MSFQLILYRFQDYFDVELKVHVEFTWQFKPGAFISEIYKFISIWYWKGSASREFIISSDK